MGAERVLGVKRGRRVRFTTLPPTVSRLDNVGSSISDNPRGPHGLLYGEKCMAKKYGSHVLLEAFFDPINVYRVTL
jgi:hypothetical protein